MKITSRLSSAAQKFINVFTDDAYDPLIYTLAVITGVVLAFYISWFT